MPVFARMSNAKVAQKVLDYLSTQDRPLYMHEISVAISESTKDVTNAVSEIVEKCDWLTTDDTKEGFSAVRNGKREAKIARYLESGGFIKDHQEMEAIDSQIREKNERNQRLTESTISVNEHTLKYSKSTRRWAIAAVIISAIALLVEILSKFA